MGGLYLQREMAAQNQKHSGGGDDEGGGLLEGGGGVAAFGVEGVDGAEQVVAGHDGDGQGAVAAEGPDQGQVGELASISAAVFIAVMRRSVCMARNQSSMTMGLVPSSG